MIVIRGLPAEAGNAQIELWEGSTRTRLAVVPLMLSLDKLTQFEARFPEWVAMRVAACSSELAPVPWHEPYRALRDRVARTYDIASDHQRYGQWAFNYLVTARPDIAERIRGTEFDPFYDDARIERFWSEVERLWSNPPGAPPWGNDRPQGSGNGQLT